MSGPIEVTVTAADYWADHAQQLALLLATAGADGPSTIPDPSGRPVDPSRMAVIVSPSAWAQQPLELRDALALAVSEVGGDTSSPSRTAAGAVRPVADRLVMSVEEAAAALGISRAFAYEAINRNEIPHIRIGHRILVPKAALNRMLEGITPSDPSGWDGPQRN